MRFFQRIGLSVLSHLPVEGKRKKIDKTVTSYYQVQDPGKFQMRNNAVSTMYSSHYALTALRLNKLLRDNPKPCKWDNQTKSYVPFHPNSDQFTTVGWDVVNADTPASSY